MVLDGQLQSSARKFGSVSSRSSTPLLDFRQYVASMNKCQHLMHVDVLQLAHQNITLYTSGTQRPSRQGVAVRYRAVSLLLSLSQVILSRRHRSRTSACYRFSPFSEARRRVSEKVSSLPQLPAFYFAIQNYYVSFPRFHRR